MSNVAIRARGLGKRYRIGAAKVRHSTLRDALTNAAAAPLRNLQRLRGLSKFSQDDTTAVVWALRDISFDVDRGEVLGIIGRNGAGKSTLLKILSRIVEPTVGYADVSGRVGSLLEVGTGFHPELTGRDNVYLNGSVLGMDRRYIDGKFDEIVDFSGVERFIDTPVKRYSSGMRLRLAFAVAAHLEPEILIVDEVLAVGDAEFQKKCIGRMDSVAREGRTVLFVSHDLTAVQRLCTRCVLLNGGQIADSGTTEDMVARYLTDGPEQAPPECWIDIPSVQRKGTGDALVKKIWYSGMDSSVSHFPYTHGSLEIRLDIDSTQPRKIDSIRVWLSSRSGHTLFDMDSMSTGASINLAQGRNTVGFHVNRLNLSPGIYTVSCKLKNRPRPVIDRVDSAFLLEVTESPTNERCTHVEVRGPVACEYNFTTLGSR